MSRKQSIYDTVSTLLDGATSVSLLIYPNHHNIGDSLIWHATVKLLDDLGIRINYICNEKNYSAEELRARNPNQPILLCGGGNFGDLYENESYVRLKAIEDFPERKIIQLPQTIYFKQPDGHIKLNKAISEHSDFTLLVRDTESLERAKKLFKCNTIMCHDTAFYLEDIIYKEFGVQSSDTDRNLWLLRTDGEKGRKSSDLSVDERDIVTDWPAEDKNARQNWPRLMRLQYILVSRFLNKTTPTLANNIAISLANALAKNRSMVGVRLVNDSNEVYTDRLHAGIMGDMLKKNTVLIDNSYGKNQSVYNFSMKDSPYTTLQSK